MADTENKQTSEQPSPQQNQSQQQQKPVPKDKEIIGKIYHFKLKGRSRNDSPIIVYCMDVCVYMAMYTARAGWEMSMNSA